MKTKYLLSALCLGVLASCSNEELVEQAISDANLPKVNLAIGAQYGDMVQTRQSYDDDLANWNYYWTNADIIGACKASGTDDLLDANNKIASNHPFTNGLKESELAKSTTFSTVTAVTTGKYILYTPYKKDMLGNEEVKPTLPEIQIQDGTSRKHLMDNNFFITPMLNIANDKGAEFEYGAKIDLPLTFKSIYHTLDMQIGITSEKPEAITVDKVVVTPTSNESGTVIKTYNGNALVFANIAKGSASGEANVVTIDADAIKDQAALSEDIQTKLDVLMDPTVEIQGGTKADNSFTLKIKDGYTYTKADDKCRVFMLIPAGSYSFLKCEVYTSEGIYTEYVKLNPANGSAVAMNRNAVTHINNSLNIHYNIGDNNVEPQKNFSINSVDDWNYACKFVSDHFNQFGDNTAWGTPTFTLKQSIEVENYPANFGLKLAADAPQTLTVKAANFSLDKTQLGGTNVTIKVANGSTLTFNTPIADAATNLKLENYGTIVNNIAPTPTDLNKSLTFLSFINGENTETGVTGTVTNNGAIAVVANGLTNNLRGTINNAAGASINANAANAIKNYGKIDLNGKDSELKVTGAAAVKNEGTISVASEAKIGDGGAGTITNVTSSNKGYIVLKDINKYTLAPATLTNQIVSVEVATLADFKKAVSERKVTDITVTAAITTDANVAATGKSITLQNNLTLKGKFTADEIIVDGTATIASDGATGRAVEAALTVNSGATLTVNKEITFNGASFDAGSTTAATILGTLNVSGKMYFVTATVGEDKTPFVKNGTLNIADVEGAVFAASEKIENYGDVNQNNGKGKVGPEIHNNGSAVFTGNADASTKTTVAG